MTTSGNVVVFGSADANTMVQAHDVASRAERVALMADNHYGYIMPAYCTMFYELFGMR